MAPDTAAWHRTAPTDKTQQHTEAALTAVGLRSATQAGWLNDWLHSGGLTIKDSGGMGEGEKLRAVEGLEREQQKKMQSHFYKVKIMNLLPLNPCLIQDTNQSVLA